MANTTSGTVTFDKTFAVDEIIEEAKKERKQSLVTFLFKRVIIRVVESLSTVFTVTFK